MAFPLIAAGIAAASTLLGGSRASKDNKKALEMSEQLQREFAQHGVRWRVEDAKAAGLHPLYALNAQLPSAQPLAMGSSMGPALADAGQSIASGMLARSTSHERVLENLSLKAAEQQLEEGDARINLLHAEAALAHQQAMATKGMPLVNASEGIPGVVDARKVNPMTGLVTPVAADLPGTEAHDPSVIAGDPALWREFTVAPGLKMLLPGGVTGDASEALESVSESIPLMWAVFRENVNRQGIEWGREFLNRFGFSGLGDAASVPAYSELAKRFLSGLFTSPAVRARAGEYYRARDSEY